MQKIAAGEACGISPSTKNQSSEVMAFSTLPMHIMGTRVMGDVAGFTCYTDSNYRKVFYPKAPPDKPPSGLQKTQRRKFRDAVNAWKSLSDADKATLERAVHKTSLCLTGQNLFTSCSLRAADGVYETIGRQAGETLPPLVRIA